MRNIAASKVVLEEGNKWTFMRSPNETKISMKSSSNSVQNAFYLAHEFGHYLSNQGNYWTKYQLGSRLQRQIKFVENKGPLSLKDMYYLLSEEVRAWWFGYRVLISLPYSFSKFSFWMTAIHAVSTYVRGYLRI